MTDIRIHNPVQNEFAMVPNVLWTWPKLSFRAKAFMAYLLSFRHGTCPPVAAMEEATGIGRDARRAVMAELREAGLADWDVQRNAAGRVVAKILVVTTVPLFAAAVAKAQVADVHAPESQAHGHHKPESQAHGVHTPEKPSVGISGRDALKSRREGPAGQAVLKKEKKDIERCAGLSDFQKARIASGQSVLVGSEMVQPGSDAMERLRQQLRLQGAKRRSGA
jgi:hypothetical protein